jgi:hypothetical protein
MSRAEQWLTLAELVPAWAAELADASHSASQLERDLWQCLQEDAKIGFLDHSGPLRNGRRLGLGFIDDNGRFQYISGRRLGTVHFPFRRRGHRIFLARKAMLALARRHWVSPFSGWPDASEGESQPSRSQVKLKTAPDRIIIEAIRCAYDAAEAAGTKPPNIKELPAAVQPLLQQKGFWASKLRIMQLGEAEEFKRRRRRPGKTVASERRKK